jgi:hypothetical protein
MHKGSIFGALAFLCLSALSHSAFAEENETEIIGICAAESGGQPALFMACALKELTFAELVKCVDGTGCFGPGNTVVEFQAWLNKELFGSCGFISQGATRPEFLVINNSSVTVEYALESDTTEGESTLAPGYHELWPLGYCDTWVNINGSGDIFGYEAGGIMEFSDGDDGYVHQYLVPVR